MNTAAYNSAPIEGNPFRDTIALFEREDMRWHNLKTPWDNEPGIKCRCLWLGLSDVLNGGPGLNRVDLRRGTPGGDVIETTVEAIKELYPRFYSGFELGYIYNWNDLQDSYEPVREVLVLAAEKWDARQSG